MIQFTNEELQDIRDRAGRLLEVNAVQGNSAAWHAYWHLKRGVEEMIYFREMQVKYLSAQEVSQCEY